MSNELTLKGRAITLINELRRDRLEDLQKSIDLSKNDFEFLKGEINGLKQAAYAVNGLTDHNSLDQYQKLTGTTAIYPKERGLEYVTLGLVGEAGEVANKVKKVIRDDSGKLSQERRAQLVDELSDVMWYVSELCSVLNVKISEVARHNIAKLIDRKSRGKLQGSGDER